MPAVNSSSTAALHKPRSIQRDAFSPNRLMPEAISTPPRCRCQKAVHKLDRRMRPQAELAAPRRRVPERSEAFRARAAARRPSRGRKQSVVAAAFADAGRGAPPARMKTPAASTMPARAGAAGK
ncbi:MULTISPECIES: hypothetical protein [Burkholderia]|uniref:hypothetical protein n=2 Tax=Burkholderiaceae TaxID=119060 RepID=UPI0013923870|nr:MULTISPECIES: hypothetical protein [Burkholderia]